MKPLKKKLLEKPLTDTAAVTEEGPGIGNIFILFLTHSSTISLPGSDNSGVPASDTNETIWPELSNSIIFIAGFLSILLGCALGMDIVLDTNFTGVLWY